MKDKLVAIHGEDFVAEALRRMEALLHELYGKETGESNYRYLMDVLDRYLDSMSEEVLERNAAFDPEDPYAHLKGKVFAICYPDNVYDEKTPTLRTLEQTLKKYFPSINGIHVLPERPMSHNDLWPQDLHRWMKPESALSLTAFLQDQGVLDRYWSIVDGFEDIKSRLESETLPLWYNSNKGGIGCDESTFVAEVMRLLDAAYDSHFNDGGFSQKSRAIVDPRFGTVEDLERISGGYAVMLDFVVNHLDIDNETLDSFRRGEDDGSAFLIVTPDRYEELKRDRILQKTFRPRPFPLFTGLRKYPGGTPGVVRSQAEEMNRRFESENLDALDPRIVAFLSIHFKVSNDQGLTAADLRIFDEFLRYLEEKNIGEGTLFRDSEIQPQQKVFQEDAGKGIAGLLQAIDVNSGYPDAFLRHDEEVFGQKFYIYTTFSESQADINPTSPAGFRMIVDDLFHLLASGDLAMMRMDAIKYLWKEVGKKNFDMEECNKLIEVIRVLLKLAAPRVLPLDEVNSPDPIVYEMGKDGGFSYLFGQVNSVPIAFNEGTLGPIKSFHRTLTERCPKNLTLFVMLSTHDGRSIQGLGVDRLDAHVSIQEFYNLTKVAEKQGGKQKYRSVPVGEINYETFRRICRDAGLDEKKASVLFTPESLSGGETYKLRDSRLDRQGLLHALCTAVGEDMANLAAVPAVDFFLEWITKGRAPYELCSTSRSSFSPESPDGKPISPETEAARLALAQLYVLTMGQVVPAIYFNDLLGLGNDTESLARTGRPRDLNRHKNDISETDLDNSSDPFRSAYVKLINRILEARVQEPAFYPGSPEFEFKALTDKVFLNHPYARGRHSFVVGNIASSTQKVLLDVESLEGTGPQELTGMKANGLVDCLSDETLNLDSEGRLTLSLPPYGALWLRV